MSPLFAIWSLSLMVVVAIIAFAYSRMRHDEVAVGGVALPSKFVEFFGDQFHDMFAHVSRVLHHVRPHAAQVGMLALSLSKRGHDLFVERVFGRIELKRGSASSFFLKHIAEEKRISQKDQRDSILH
jgi:hypothetical protein